MTVPADMRNHAHPKGRPWKAQVSFKLNTTGKRVTVYLGCWPSFMQAVEVEEAYIRKHLPERTHRRFIWDEEKQTNIILERVDEKG